MTGAEHYATAEQLLAGLVHRDGEVNEILAEAQVHATLAVAAAVAAAAEGTGVLIPGYGWEPTTQEVPR